MVNFGRSGACITCKQRKVKCDESRPGCKKCRRVGRACPGYPDQWDLAFRNENKIVQRKVHMNKQAFKETPSPKLLILETVIADERLQAICLFFQDYTISSCGPCPGWLHFLPKMYQMSTANSFLHHAVCTAAYANLAQKIERPDLAIMAMSHYRESLEIVKQTLVLPKTAVDDSTMTGVMLLGVYEYINSTLSEGLQDSQYHHCTGLETLADLRGSLLLQGYGPNLLQIVCCQMQRKNLDQRIAPSSTDERLLKLLDPSSLANQMIINKFEVSKFIAKIDAKIRLGQISTHWADIWNDFQQLESELSLWGPRAMAQISFIQVYHPASLDDSEPPIYHTYPGFWSLSIWNKHRAARILLHQTLLEGLDELHSSRPGIELSAIEAEQKTVSLAVIQEMADFIFASIPFSLGEIPAPILSCNSGPKSIGGFFLVWVLQVVLRCSSLPERYRTRAKDSLLRIGRQCGISYATIFARKYGTLLPQQTFKSVTYHTSPSPAAVKSE